MGVYSGEFDGKRELTLSFSSDEWRKMKSALEVYDNVIQLSDSEFADKLAYWAYKSIRSNIHSIELQNKLKP